MADPLSISASIAGVISLADIVFIRMRKYLNSAKNADKEVKDLSQEVLLLSGALHSLSKLAQALDADGLNDQHIDSLRMHHIAACHATLDEVEKKLKKLEDKATKRKLVWPFVSDRTAELLAEISRHRDSVNLALTADSMRTLLQILSKTAEVHGNTERLLNEAKKTREIVTRIHQDSGRKDILNNFLPYNPQQNYEMSLSLRHPRTGLWLTRKPEFQTWLGNPDSALWLSGIPGAGKTVLAGTIIEEALKRGSEDVATAFFFCDYKDARTQTVCNVLSAFASQLAIQKEDAYCRLECYHRELHPDRALERRPDVSGLQRVLKDMVKSFDQVYFIVDGLDECGDNTDDVIDGILDVVECSDNISTALLSRDEYNIRDRLEDDFTGVEIAAHTEDITEYITSEIEKRISNKTLRIADLGLKGEILERLVDGAKGMFRWVACQLDFLGDCISDKECRESLGQLPPGLNESYMRILRRVPTGKERIVQMILNFIAYATPKLDVPMLREALSVPGKVGKDDVLNAQSIIREDSITRLCRSLIRKSNDGCYYEFAHFSVQEFLEGEMQSLPGFETFKISQSICQLLLTKQCLKYLLLQNFSSFPTETTGLEERRNMRIKNHPFYCYAAVHWPVFASTHWADENLVDLATILFQPKKTGNFIAWALELTSCFASQALGRRDYRTNEKSSRTVDEYRAKCTLDLLPQLVDKTFTTLHVAAALSLPVLCSSLIEQGGNINQGSPFGCPLQCAVQGLFFAVSDAHDTEDVALPEPYCSLSYWKEKTISSEFGRENTIRLFLRAGAAHVPACSSPFEGETLMTVALKLAFSLENMGAINGLLEGGYEPDANTVDQLDIFWLHWMGHGGINDNGDDTYRLESVVICLSPIIGRSAAHFQLCQAVWSLAIEMDCKFARDPSIVDTRISLSEAALAKTIFVSVGDADIETLAEALKDTRIDWGLENNCGHTIFEHWIEHFDQSGRSDRLTMMSMLLSAGMEVDQPDHNGLLPLHRLARFMDMIYDDSCCNVLGDIIREFVRRGTGCTARSRANQNVLHLGLWSVGFIKAVLEAETDENILTAAMTQDEDGYTPITLALETGKEEVALVLMENTHYNPGTLRGCVSVHALCVARGTQRAFNALLGAGIGYDSADCRKTSLLYHVGPKTSKEFVLQLTRMFPDEVKLRVDNRFPLDAYLENCNDPANRGFDPANRGFDLEVLQLLAKPGSDEIGQRDKKQMWENFMLSTRNATRLEYDHRKAYLNSIRETNTTKAVAGLLRLGFLRSYEAMTHAPGILPLLKPLRGSLNDLWPLTLDTICEILEQTICWESLRESVEMLRLLKIAVKSCAVSLVKLLLGNSVSVHHRIDNMSALEAACLESTERPDSKNLFTLVLSHAETSRLDEINPHQGQHRGLVHYLIGHGKQWQLAELLKRGADVNLRTSSHDMEEPAIVYHLKRGSLETAMTLLDKRASPAIADSRGVDAALAAASQGYIGFLLRLYAAEDLELNWKRTCRVSFRGTRGMSIAVSGANALHMAGWCGDCDVLRFYMDKGLLTDINAVSMEELTPMHLAAFAGQAGAIKFLYSRGGDLNLKSAGGSLPLHLAVRNGYTEVVRFLIENGSAMDVDVRGLSPVGYAMQLRNQSILDCLQTTEQYLEYQSEPGRCKKDLVYAYEQALMRGDVKECERLRGLGCPVSADLPGQKGRSALVLAIENSNQELIKWLLAHNAKARKKYLTGRVWVSALHVMVMRPALNNLLPLLLRIFLSQGGSVTTERPSLICIAIDSNNNIGLRLLLDHIVEHEATEPNIQVNGHIDHRGSTVNLHILNGQAPLHWAARRGNFEAVQVLIDHRADVNAFDYQKMTPLQVAIQSEPLRESSAARLLLRHGAALESRNGFGETAVMLASKRGNTELVRLLVDSGADLGATSFNLDTCLHCAATGGHLELFVWLVDRGLQLHAKNSLGWSAIQYASFKKVFSSFLLNFGSAFDDIDAIAYTTPASVTNPGPAWLNEHFSMYLRRLGVERLRALANLEPADSWRPLCMSASMGQILAVTNILQLGADVDFEGSSSSSALMAACSSGRLESVKILARHVLLYLEGKGICSAVNAARHHKAILAWLLVDRFMEQRKLSEPAYADSAADSAEDMKPWSGVVKKELTITGTAEKQVHESARGYWSRLMAVKRAWQGKVVDQNKLAQTHRPSRLVPDEPVRICPGDYGTPKELR